MAFVLYRTERADLLKRGVFVGIGYRSRLLWGARICSTVGIMLIALVLNTNGYALFACTSTADRAWKMCNSTTADLTSEVDRAELKQFLAEVRNPLRSFWHFGR